MADSDLLRATANQEIVYPICPHWRKPESEGSFAMNQTEHERIVFFLRKFIRAAEDEGIVLDDVSFRYYKLLAVTVGETVEKRDTIRDNEAESVTSIRVTKERVERVTLASEPKTEKRQKKSRLCACGCGEVVTGRKDKTVVNATHRKRLERQNKYDQP